LHKVDAIAHANVVIEVFRRWLQNWCLHHSRRSCVPHKCNQPEKRIEIHFCTVLGVHSRFSLGVPPAHGVIPHQWFPLSYYQPKIYLQYIVPLGRVGWFGPCPPC
jgi:hypothetical protein